MDDWIKVVVGGVSAIVGGAATQGFALWKEYHASKKAQFRDMQFIGVELLLKLAELSEHCRKISHDFGEPYFDMDNGQETSVISVHAGSFTLKDIQGKWDALPAELLFSVRELPLALTRIERFLGEVAEHEEDNFFTRRREMYGKQAARIEALTERLRVRCELPEDHDIHD